MQKQKVKIRSWSTSLVNWLAQLTCVSRSEPRYSLQAHTRLGSPLFEITNLIINPQTVNKKAYYNLNIQILIKPRMWLISNWIHIAKLLFIKIISFYKLKHLFPLRNGNDVRPGWNLTLREWRATGRWKGGHIAFPRVQRVADDPTVAEKLPFPYSRKLR